MSTFPTDRVWVFFGGAIPGSVLNALLSLLAGHEDPPYFGVIVGRELDTPESPDFNDRLAWWNDIFHQWAREGKPAAIALVDPNSECDSGDHVCYSIHASSLIHKLCEANVDFLYAEPFTYEYESGEMLSGSVCRGYADGRRVDVPLNSDYRPLLYIQEGDWFTPSHLAQRAKAILAAMQPFRLSLCLPRGFRPDGLPENDLEPAEQDEEELDA